MVLEQLENTINQGKKKLALLIDPDKTFGNKLTQMALDATKFDVDFIFYGGSLINNAHFANEILRIKEFTNIPIVLFPGSNMQVSDNADAILFLSLLSSRNPEYLIGQQVVAAPFVRNSNLESVSTAYLLVDGGRITTAHYMSNSLPIPSDKPEIAINTAIAAELMGFKCIYLDAGSGAMSPVPEDLIYAVKQNISIPLIVGGGINTPEKLNLAYNAGADVAVIGTSIENDPSLLKDFAKIVKSFA